MSLLKPKLAPHGSSPLCFCVVKLAVTSSFGVGVAHDVDASDVAPLAQVELRRDRDVGVEIRLPGLNRSLRRVVEDERPAAARVGRHRVDAVELRDLLPASR